MPVDIIANNATTQLQSPMGATDTSITVTGIGGFTAPSIGQQVKVQIDNEILIVTNMPSTTWNVLRGVDGTTATTHTPPASVTLVVPASTLNNFVQLQNGTLFNQSGTISITGPQYLTANPSTLTNPSFQGSLSIGSGPWDGTSMGHFAGSASGTGLAMNFASGYTGNLLDLQVNGLSNLYADSLGNIFSNTRGSTGNNPRIIGMNGFAANEFARFQFGGTANALTVGGGTQMQLSSFWGLNIYGNTNGGAPGYPAGGNTTDKCVSIINVQRTGITVLAIVGVAAQTGDLQQWQNNSNTVLAKVDANGQGQFAGLTTNLATKTTAYTMTNTDSVILVGAASLTMTLPSAVTAGAGRTYTVKNTGAGTSTTVASTAGSIDGATTYTGLSAAYVSAQFISDGSNWFIL